LKHLLILISLLLLSPFLTSCEKNVEVVVEKKPILFRDTPYSKFVEGGKKWFKTGDEKTQVKYEGEIVNGVPNGQGTMTCCDGVKYVGGYKDGEKNGQGTETFPDGGKYVGEFRDGKRHGQGTFTWSDGQKDVGEFKDGLQNGQGTETYPNGQKYVGEFKDGKYHGQGTYSYPDGRKKMGEFREGKGWNVIGYDQNGNEKIKWVNGKIEQ